MDNAPRTPIYLDAEDDITSIISKVSASKDAMVGLVVPKRSSALGSVVNLKLVRKSAEADDKKLVLITDDSKINLLAARLEILTAPNLKAEPIVPPLAGETAELPSNVIEEEAAAFPAPPLPVSSAPPGPSSPPSAPKALTPASAVNKAKDSKSKIPDFNRFKKKLLIGGLLLLALLIALWAALFVLPKAAVSIKGRTEPLAVESAFTLDTTATKVDLEQAVLPGKNQEISKTLTATFPATGKKDVGTKASGTITVKQCVDSDESSYSAGTQFTANGRTFTANQAFEVEGAKFSGGICSKDGSGSVSVSAAENGDSYNLGPTTYTSASVPSGYAISGAQMSGGSSKTVAVIAQNDVDSAKADLLAKDKAVTQKEMLERFDKEDHVIVESFTQNVAEASSDPPVGTEANNGRVIIKAIYLQSGVKKTDLEAFLRHQLEKKVKDNKNQLGVADAGLEKAAFAPQARIAPSAQKFGVKTEGLLGPNINFESLSLDLKGKRYGEGLELIKKFPNVTDAEIKLSPFWVNKLPRKPERINIKLDVPSTDKRE